MSHGSNESCRWNLWGRTATAGWPDAAASKSCIPLIPSMYQLFHRFLGQLALSFFLLLIQYFALHQF
jgi:hypothetical protein